MVRFHLLCCAVLHRGDAKRDMNSLRYPQKVDPYQIELVVTIMTFDFEHREGHT